MKKCFAAINGSERNPESKSRRCKLHGLDSGETCTESSGHNAFRRRVLAASGLVLPLLIVPLLATRMLFAQSAQDALHIGSNGNVGIGTDKPMAKLDVGGSASFKNVAINCAPIADQHFVIVPKKDYIPFNVTDPDNKENWLTVRDTGNVEMDRDLEVGGGIEASSLLLKGNPKETKFDAQHDKYSTLLRFMHPASQQASLNVKFEATDKGRYRIGFAPDDGLFRFWSDYGTGNAYVKGNLGIGTEEPSAPLVVQGDDNNYLKLMSINNKNTGANAQAGLQMRTGDNEKFTGSLFQQNHDLWLWNNDDQGDILFANGVNTGNQKYMLVFDKNGDVTVPGKLWARGGLAYYWMEEGWYGIEHGSGGPLSSTKNAINKPSDMRLKRDLHPIPSALAKVNRLRGVSFHWNEQGLKYLTSDIESTLSAGPDASEEENRKVWQAERDKRYKDLSNIMVGIIAQDVEAVLPEAVSTDENGYKSVRYYDLIPLLIQALKEEDKISKGQADTIARQQSEVQRLTLANEAAQQQLSQLQELKQRLTHIEAAVGNVMRAEVANGFGSRPIPALNKPTLDVQLRNNSAALAH